MTQKEDLFENKEAFSWARQPLPIPVEKITENIEADVVIIGAGHAGTCAARAASEVQGIRVVVIEQQNEEKQYILGIGEVGHINSKWQESFNVPKVDIDEFVNDWQLRTNNRSNYRLIRKYAEKSGECFDWFIEPLTYEEKNKMYPMIAVPSVNMPKSLNGIHAYTGSAYMTLQVQNSALKKNQNLAKNNGAVFYFETRAEQLIIDKLGVKGVIARKNDGTYIRITSLKGVILAAGDYSKNAQMCRDLLTGSADLIDQNTDWSGHGWDGSGIQMGVWAGGRLEPRTHAATGGNYSFPGFDVIGSTAVLRVNKYGRRYSNEGFATHILAATAGAIQPNGMLWGVFDSDIFDEITYQTPCHAVFDYCSKERVQELKDILNKAKQSGKEGYRRGTERITYCADTLEELASFMFNNNQAQSTFLKEVNRYNELCFDGKDLDFGKEPALLHPIINGPFYATGQIKNSHHPGGQSLKLLVTVSGLLIDENQQVLDEEFEPIIGLYATGNCSGCRFGSQYTTSVPGQSISIAHTLGREVGYYAASRKI